MKLKINFKSIEQRKKIDNEIQNKLDYMAKIGPGEEYQDCLGELNQLYEIRRQMSWTYKMREALPWIGLGVTAVGTIGVPIALGKLAYRNSEEQGKLKEGDVWREAISNQAKPQTQNNNFM